MFVWWFPDTFAALQGCQIKETVLNSQFPAIRTPLRLTPLKYWKEARNYQWEIQRCIKIPWNFQARGTWNKHCPQKNDATSPGSWLLAKAQIQNVQFFAWFLFQKASMIRKHRTKMVMLKLQPTRQKAMPGSLKQMSPTCSLRARRKIRWPSGNLKRRKFLRAAWLNSEKMTESSLEYTIHLISRVDHVISCWSIPHVITVMFLDHPKVYEQATCKLV